MSTVRHAPRRSRIVFALLTCVVLASVSLINLRAQTPQTPSSSSDLAAERAQAAKLIGEHRYYEALPLLEKISQADPRDGQTFFYLGFARLASTKTLKDPAARRQSRLQARAAMLKAKELGVKHPLLDSLLESVPPDGGRDEVFSANAGADAAMRDGEAAFVRGELDAAINFYRKALELDPQLYEAALFVGDMYFKKGDFQMAGDWYERAIKINPDRETAYRYSASPLMEQGKLEEARARYIEAIIAEPYTRMSWAGLGRWAQASRVQLAHPRIEPPATVSTRQDNKIVIEMKPGERTDDGSAAWAIYGLARASWQTEKFAKEYPQEKTYRHSLKEEAEALRLVAESVKTQQKEGRVKTLDPMLARVVRLSDAGLLEAYILLARPDEGIVRDYADYRKTNREKLRRYLVEYVTSGRAEPGN